MNSEELIDFGKRVKQIRSSLHISQKDFAAKIGISGSFLSEIESGSTKPGYEFFKNITLEYNVNHKYLHTGEGDIFLDTQDENRPEKGIEIKENRKIVEEMLWYFNHVPVVKFAVLEFFKRYLYEKKGLIEEEIEKNLKSDKNNKG
jgi:transcriptional regulator with XRE-family HTH domain